VKQGGSRKVVIAALAGNTAIAAVKFAVALLTRSSAMFAEAVHSFADAGNQVLLLVGGWRGARPADPSHPFGHGRETYFWSFLVAVLLFALGAVASIHEGVTKILSPHPMTRVGWIYAVLSVSFAIESWSLHKAVSEFGRIRDGMGKKPGIVGSVRALTDPSVLVVLMEDAAALCGLAIAFAGVLLAHLTGNPVFDAGASVAIGCLLAAVSVFLSNEIRLLIAGEGFRPEDVEAVRVAALSVPGVRSISEIRTMHLGPVGALVAIDAEFSADLSADGVEHATLEIRTAVRKATPGASHIYVNSTDTGMPAEKATA